MGGGGGGGLGGVYGCGGWGGGGGLNSEVYGISVIVIVKCLTSL